MRYGYARVSGSSQDYRVQNENLKPADLRVLSPAGHLGLNGHFENETLRFNTQCPRAATLQEARLMKVKHDHEPFPCVLDTDDVYPKLEPTPVSEAAWRSLLMEIEYYPEGRAGIIRDFIRLFGVSREEVEKRLAEHDERIERFKAIRRAKAASPERPTLH
jgi:hypothetical protein